MNTSTDILVSLLRGELSLRPQFGSKPSCSGLGTERLALDTASDITAFNMLQRGPSASDGSIDNLPDLPSALVADKLVEAVYLYTQARYCIVDWVRLRQWHQQRDKICYSSGDGEPEAQIGTLWMIYSLRDLVS